MSRSTTPLKLVLAADRQLHGDDLVRRRPRAGRPRARSKSARSRSSMLQNDDAGAGRRRRRASQSRSVWTSTPSTVLTTTSAVSTTRRAAMVSAWKLESPGVSMRLKVRPSRSTWASRRRQAELPRASRRRPSRDDRRAVGDRAQAVDHSGTKQQRLEQGRLAGAAVADEGDVPDLAWVVHPGLLGVVFAGRPRAARARRPCVSCRKDEV